MSVTMLVAVVVWFAIYPNAVSVAQQTGDYSGQLAVLTLTSITMHALNVVFMMTEFVLNGLLVEACQLLDVRASLTGLCDGRGSWPLSVSVAAVASHVQAAMRSLDVDPGSIADDVVRDGSTAGADGSWAGARFSGRRRRGAGGTGACAGNPPRRTRTEMGRSSLHVWYQSPKRLYV